MHATSAGKVLLLNYTPQMLQKFIETRGVAALTPNTIISPEDLVTTRSIYARMVLPLMMRNMNRAYGLSHAPVYDYENNITAAISVSGPTNRMNYQKINHKKIVVIESAQEISNV
jgi:DNA-binding IclR family transcriptional regulator